MTTDRQTCPDCGGHYPLLGDHICPGVPVDYIGTYFCQRCKTSHANGTACPWNKDAILGDGDCGRWERCPACDEYVLSSAHNCPVARVLGDGPAAPIVVGEDGGRQSALEVSFMLIDPFALWRLAEILYHGSQTHGPDNWRKIPIEDHLDHAVAHIVQWCAGDKQDDHLGHAFCRMMMAKALELEHERNTEDHG